MTIEVSERPVRKKQYWCVFCSYKEWVEGEEKPRSCPRCEQGMFCWEGSQDE